MKPIYVDLYGIRMLAEFCDRVMHGVAKTTDEMSFLKKALQFAFRLRSLRNEMMSTFDDMDSPFCKSALTGAGGGGFLFALAKSRAARQKMEKVLASAGTGGRCYRFAVDTGR